MHTPACTHKFVLCVIHQKEKQFVVCEVGAIICMVEGGCVSMLCACEWVAKRERRDGAPVKERC